jgi:predicted enzyme related to lactoylglutathione lyase
MKPRIGDIMFDSVQPPILAEFWAKVLHYEMQESSRAWAAIVDPQKRGPRLCFQQVVTPKTHKNRIHFDIFVENRETEVKRIQQLGATCERVGEENGVTWTVMLDPEGNEFCIQTIPPGAN